MVVRRFAMVVSCSRVSADSTMVIGHVGGGPLGHPKIYINLVRILIIPFMTLCSYPSGRTNQVLVHAGTLNLSFSVHLTHFHLYACFSATGKSPYHTNMIHLTTFPFQWYTL